MIPFHMPTSWLGTSVEPGLKGPLAGRFVGELVDLVFLVLGVFIGGVGEAVSVGALLGADGEDEAVTDWLSVGSGAEVDGVEVRADGWSFGSISNRPKIRVVTVIALPTAIPKAGRDFQSGPKANTKAVQPIKNTATRTVTAKRLFGHWATSSKKLPITPSRPSAAIATVPILGAGLLPDDVVCPLISAASRRGQRR
jgi:hypothetical protein